MSTSPYTSGRRLKSFRLADIPITIRQRAADRLLKQEDEFAERIKIGIAASRPSDKVYHVSLDAWNRVVKPPKTRHSAYWPVNRRVP